MLSKSKIKLVNQLRQKKHRQLNNMFFVEGSRCTIDFLNSDTSLIDLFATEEWLENNDQNVKITNPIAVNKKELKKISALANPSDVLAVFELPSSETIIKIDNSNLSIALDNISDPGNLGTIIRTADWFGITDIYCSNNTVDAFNPKVVQATMGSLSRTNIVYTDLHKLLSNRPNNIPVFGAFLDGISLHEYEPHEAGIILIGSEAHGISNELTPLIDNKITIPMANKNIDNRPESLNASVAASIICYALKIRT